MKYGSLTWKNGQVNPSGIKSIAYWIPKEDIESFPTIDVDAAATVQASVTYLGDFVPKTGKKFLTIYTTQGKGKTTFEATGEKDCKIFTNKATLKYPDINDDAKALAMMALNGNCIFIIPRPGSKFEVIGSEDYDVTTTPAGDSGDAPGSDKGLTLTVEAPDVVPLPLYAGVLALETGSLDCETGVFTPTAP